jgi:hypothetical protein
MREVQTLAFAVRRWRIGVTDVDATSCSELFSPNRSDPGGRSATVHSVCSQQSRAEDAYHSPAIGYRSYAQPPISIASAPRTPASAIGGRPHGRKNEAGRRATPARPRAPSPSRWNDQRPSSCPPRLGADSIPRRARSQSDTTPPLFSNHFLYSTALRTDSLR